MPLSPGPTCQRENRGGKGTAVDGVAAPVMETGEEMASLAEWWTGLGSVPQPLARLSPAAGSRGGGGGSPELVRRQRAVATALEALNLSTSYVCVCAGAR